MSNSVDIMLVEDDEIDIESTKRAFNKQQIANPLHIAHNGLEALEHLNQCRTNNKLKLPKIILLDINMPKMNGIEFLQKIRTIDEYKSILVFVLTSSKNEHDLISAYEFNVAGYIVKPVSFESFLEKIKGLKLYWSLIEMTS